MWTTVLAVAWAEDITVEEAQALGLPRRHEVGAGGDSLVLAWADGAEDTVLRLPRDRVAAVLHRAEDGVHDLGVRLIAGEELWIEHGPCPVVTAMADTYEAFFAVPVEGSGEGVQCVDVAAEAEAYRQTQLGRLHPVVEWNAAPIAGITATDRRGEPVFVVQRGLAPSRPWLGGCFETGPEAVERHVILAAVVLPDGTMRKLSVVGAADAVSDCVVERLAEATMVERPEKKTRTKLDVDWRPRPLEEPPAPAPPAE